jgi:hypothetical protein
VWSRAAAGYENLNGLSNALKIMKSHKLTFVASLKCASRLGSERAGRIRRGQLERESDGKSGNSTTADRCCMLCYLAKHEAPFRGDDEKESSLNRGLFIGVREPCSKV